MRPKSFSRKKCIFKNAHLDLYSVIAKFDTYSREYFVLKKGDRVGVVVERDGSILLVKQYRYVINDFSWELPSGGVNKGESLKGAAIRECAEEGGIKCKRLKLLFKYIAGADVMDSTAYIFTCKDFQDIGSFDKKEISEAQWVHYSQCLKMIFSREIKDIFTIIGFLSYGYSFSGDHLLTHTV